MPWVRDSSRWTFGSRANTAGVGRDRPVDVGEPEEPPRTACIKVLIEESIRTDSPSPRMYGSTCARWIPTSGSSSLDSHQPNQRLSW